MWAGSAVARHGIVLLLLFLGGRGFSPVPCNETQTLDCGMSVFREVYKLFHMAQEEVTIMPFYLRPSLKIFSSKDGQPPDVTLSDLILQAIQRKVHVWILGWDNAASEKFLNYNQDHEYEMLFEEAKKLGATAYLHLMLDTGRELVASVFYLPHIKSYAFDRKVAVVGGIDFVENRLDTPAHIRPNPLLVRTAQDARHPTMNEKPWQDVMIKVTGPAARQVAMILIERWWTYCASQGFARTQAMRPINAVLDSTLWHVKGAMSISEWKEFQCEERPAPAILGLVDIRVTQQTQNITTNYSIIIDTPAVQSVGLDSNIHKNLLLQSGEHRLVNVTGLHALDTNVPKHIDLEIDGRTVTATWNDTVHLKLGNETLTAKWLPEGVWEPDTKETQMCKVTISGSKMWMGTSGVVTESYDAYLNSIRNAKRFIFIENQYFSTDFPSSSPECQHMHDRTRAVLYSGAKNRVGEVLLDRIKRAAYSKEKFTVSVILPLGTEPGSFYPNLRGAYCFEESVEELWKSSNLESDWRDYFSIFFLANAVPVPEDMGGPGSGFYGIFTHTKSIVVDDEVAYVGSANINDRSLLGDRDAEVGVTVWNGPYPRQFRETLLEGHLGGSGKANASDLLASLHKVANENAAELKRTMRISFPEGTVTRNNVTRMLFGMEALLNGAPNQVAELNFQRSRVIAGGGGLDHFDWYVVPEAISPPKLQGLLFPWSRRIWGLPKMTHIAQIFSGEFNYMERPLESESWLGPPVPADQPMFL
eukprot:TRINITY_DN90607_c0_g1_i1.p1 TRINITY_DN90607_c0_g1~~TRINITY_DN90607_c0_g1_i1.p1  ORF type:complete len:759 (-),score=94.12 TRINITY_DN90607_c0_g1_i1:211-2487(-)